MNNWTYPLDKRAEQKKRGHLCLLYWKLHYSMRKHCWTINESRSLKTTLSLSALYSTLCVQIEFYPVDLVYSYLFSSLMNMIWSMGWMKSCPSYESHLDRRDIPISAHAFHSQHTSGALAQNTCVRFSHASYLRTSSISRAEWEGEKGAVSCAGWPPSLWQQSEQWPLSHLFLPKCTCTGSLPYFIPEIHPQTVFYTQCGRQPSSPGGKGRA